MCVALSGRLADMWCHPQPETAIHMAIDLSQELLGIDAEGVLEVARHMSEGIPDMSAFFQVSLGKPEDIQKVLDLLEQTINEPAPTEVSEPVSVIQ